MSGGLAFFSVCFPSIFSIVDPIGVVPVYLALVGGGQQEQRRTAIRAVATATGVLVLFAATGAAVFRFFGITIPAFKVAGGVLLGTMALEMMRAKTSPVKSTPEEESDARAKDDIAVTPIGIPLISGPGAIANAILWSSRALGKTGINVITRIMGLILAATAAQFVIDGWREAMAG
jgi:multiple antibiotic resistance protein